MFNDFLKYIKENKLMRKGDKILAAVSGGIDSMAMANLLLKAGYLSGIAHCNFGLRGKESDMDEELVRKYAAKNRITFCSIHFRTKDYAKKKGISIEMAARELRYDWFEIKRTKKDYDAIAVAHNLNDNVETLMLNLIRGTGISGLTGMKPLSGNIIRPLLFATRKSIEEYCCENKIVYREDRTNADTKFIRNKIRHQILPLMKEINPSVETTLNETAGRLNGIYGILSDIISTTRDAIFRNQDGNIIVNISKLKPYMDNEAFAFELFKPYGITGSLLKDLNRVIAGRTGTQVFTGTHRILKNRNEIVISEYTSGEIESLSYNSAADLKKSAVIASSKIITLSKNFNISTDSHNACLDYQKILFPVVIRKWKPGDYFYPFGMKQKKKLSDYFIDRKFSRLKKEKAMLLESDGKIAWIIGERIDNRFRVTKLTRKVLVLTTQ